MTRDLPEIIREYEDYLIVIQEKAESTVKSYLCDINLFINFLKTKEKFKEIEEGEVFINNIELTDIYSFLSFVKRERNNSAYARARKIASIKSFFKYCETKLKIIEHNPCHELEVPKLPKRQIAYLDLRESKKILTDVVGRNKERDYCILVLFLNCGMRLSELCNIKLSDIREDMLVVRGKGDKDRTVYLNEVCMQAIKDYLEVRDKMETDYLFLSERHKKICKREVQYIVKKNLEDKELDIKKYSTHKLRHTAATLLYKYGHVDIRTIQKILGHKNIGTTEVYTHVDEETLRKAVKLNPLNKEEGKEN